MNNRPAICQPERVRAFLTEAMSADGRTAFEAHLEECEACRRALDLGVASTDDWSELQVSLSRSHEVALENAVAEERFSGAGSGLEFCKRMLGPTDDPRMLGRIGAYEIVGLLGHGGMGVVFKGLDPSLNRYVAIKMLAPMFATNGVSKQRFLREAQSAAAVVHEHVVPIHCISDWQETPYLVMALVRGESLQKRLTRRGFLPLRELLRIGRQVAAGLAAAHAQGLIHRDIKPANILLESDVDRAIITDFGLARAVDDIRLTRTDTLLGTPQYMSPEQARDEALDFRTDLFSLGVVIYEAATGRAPFQAATSYGTLRKIVDHDPKPIRQLNPDIPEWFDRIVQKLIAKNPSDRFQTATEVSALFEQCLAHVEQPNLVELPPALVTKRAQNPTLNRSRVMTVTILAGLVVGGWLMFAPADPKDSASRGDQTKIPASAESEADQTASSGLGSTSAGGYKIRIRKVENLGGQKMDIDFDFSKLGGRPQIKSVDSANGSVFAGTSSGTSNGSFNRPNLGIAFSIQPKDPKGDFIVEVSSKAEAYDDQGNKLEGVGEGASRPRFRQFESSVSFAPVLYLSGRQLDSNLIKELKGQLLITPGKVTTATFMGPEFEVGKAKDFGGKSFTLKSVEKDDKAITVNMNCPPTRASTIAGSPQQHLEAMMLNRGAYKAEIVDDKGETHSATSTNITSGNASGQANAGGAVNGLELQLGGQGGGDEGQSFQFQPLPAGREIKMIRVTMTERNGPAKGVDFTLRNIPLP